MRRIRTTRTPLRRTLAGAAVAAVAVPAALAMTAGTARAAAPAAASYCNPKAGPYQKQVESYLHLKADGKQSRSDCRAIQAFQKKQNVQPTQGYAGPLTHAKIQWLKAVANPNKAHHCPTNRGRIACVDLSRQIMWVQKGKKVVFGPKQIRTGRAGYATRDGNFRVYWRHIDHVSTIYHVPMPYSQFFSGGQAFHAVDMPMSTPPGSHGCVNMSRADAKALWSTLKLNDPVKVFGHKPGT